MNLRGFGKRGDNINQRDSLCSILNLRQLSFNFIAHFAEKIVFKISNSFLRAEDFSFVILQFGRDIPLGINKRLLTNVIVGNFTRAAFTNFDVVAENFIITNFKRTNAGFNFLLLLELL